MGDPGEELPFSCPDCSGPLHAVDRDVECERGHRFTLAELMHQRAHSSAQATWRAAEHLRQRAASAAWAADNYPLSRDEVDKMRAAAAEDAQQADALERKAKILDESARRSARRGDRGRPEK